LTEAVQGVQFLRGEAPGTWRVRFSAGEVRHARVEVTDIAGRTVRVCQAELPAEGGEIPLDLENLSPGTYILSAEVAGRRSAIRILRR
ncbi:MAG: hypothetical protein ACI4UC_08000, partial [Alloprevotella sp.]